MEVEDALKYWKETENKIKNLLDKTAEETGLCFSIKIEKHTSVYYGSLNRIADYGVIIEQ